jgi:hypothetical protein
MELPAKEQLSFHPNAADGISTSTKPKNLAKKTIIA